MSVKYYLTWYCITNCGNVMHISPHADVIVKSADIHTFWPKGKMQRKRTVITIDGNSSYTSIVIRDFFPQRSS